MPHVKVYGADWCAMTKRTLKHLQEIGADYEYIDIDRNREAAAWVAAQNGGKERKPTLDIDGRVLSVPSNADVDAALATSNS
jgi:mycoredoxin